MNKGSICRKELIPPRTNLKYIGIVSNFSGKKENYPSPKPHYNFKIFKGKNDHNTIEEMGRGSNGVVYLVDWKKAGQDSDEKIVLKYPLTESDYEPNRVTKVLKGYHHHIIPYKVIHDQYGNPFIVMQQATGDLFELVRYDLSSQFRDKIIRYYTKAIGQLWRKRIVFTDMKAENLLYQCHQGSSRGSAGLVLYFGDIGAFANEGDGYYDYEVEPPETKYIDKNFCLFTIGLMVISIYRIKYKRPESGKKNSFEINFYNPVKEQVQKSIKNKKIRDITLKILSPDRSDRDGLSVNQVVKIITES